MNHSIFYSRGADLMSYFIAAFYTFRGYHIREIILVRVIWQIYLRHSIFGDLSCDLAHFSLDGLVVSYWSNPDYSQRAANVVVNYILLRVGHSILSLLYTFISLLCVYLTSQNMAKRTKSSTTSRVLLWLRVIHFWQIRSRDPAPFWKKEKTCTVFRWWANWLSSQLRLATENLTLWTLTCAQPPLILNCISRDEEWCRSLIFSECLHRNFTVYTVLRARIIFLK